MGVNYTGLLYRFSCSLFVPLLATRLTHHLSTITNSHSMLSLDHGSMLRSSQTISAAPFILSHIGHLAGPISPPKHRASASLLMACFISAARHVEVDRGPSKMFNVGGLLSLSLVIAQIT